jgi:PAS domain S-box-containing protein
MEQWLSPGRRQALFLIPVLTILLAATNDLHGWIWVPVPQGTTALPQWSSIGYWYVVQVGYSLLVVGAGVLLIWKMLWRMHREQRWRRMIIVLGATTPVVGLLLGLSGAGTTAGPILMPTFLLVGVASLSWTVAGQQILDLVPIARQTVLSSMPDGVLVVNNQDRLVEINPAAQRIIGPSAEQALGQRIVEVIPQWRDLWYRAIVNGELQTSLDVRIEDEWRIFDLRISPVYAKGRHLTGRLIILRDITDHKRNENELIERRKLVEKLVAVARATTEGSSLQATLQNALDVTTSLTGAEYGSLFLLDSGGRVTHSILARGATAPGSRRKIVGTVMDDGLAGWVVRNRKTVLLHDTLEDERWVTFPDQPYTARSVLVVPITSGDTVPGVLTLQHSQPGTFDAEDEALLRAASDQMALALHKAQLYEEQIQFARRQQMLFEALKTVGRHLEPTTVLHLATETIARQTNWSAVGILVAENDGSDLKMRAGAGPLASHEGKYFSGKRGDHARPLATKKTFHRISFEPGEKGRRAFPFLQSAIFVPFRYGQDQPGILVVGNESAASFDDDDILLAESLAEVVGMTMTNAQLFQAVADEHSRLQALIEASRDGVILVSDTGRILFLNHMALKVAGISDEPVDWLFRPLRDLFTSLGAAAPRLLELLQVETQRRHEDDSGIGEGEIVVNDRFLHWQNLPVRTEQATVGRLIVLEDVSRERALQRLRDDLTHTMVHDLRNPLNIVSGSLQMVSHGLTNDTPTTELRKVLDIASQSTSRMLHLVNGILNISRLESEQVPLNPRPLEMPALVERVLTAQQSLAADKEITLSGQNGVAADGIPVLQADPELIERVLQNLIGNAIKFTPHGGEIAVNTTHTANPNLVSVQVRDTGPGIPADIQEQLFEKFVTGLQEAKGAGLGLAFCRMAVEAHGGKIWAENNQGAGASFYFTLPVPNSEE